MEIAEQAQGEDKANNYEAGAQLYMTAAEWLMQATKGQLFDDNDDRPCGPSRVLDGEMNSQMRQTILAKIESCVRRTKEITNLLENGTPNEKEKVERADKSTGTDDNSVAGDYIQVKCHPSRFPSAFRLVQKGIRSAEQATAEDEANNYEAAAQHYMTAADWLMQAMKCQYPMMTDTVERLVF